MDWYEKIVQASCGLELVGGGICQFAHGVFTPYRSSDGLSGDLVVSVLEDREGSLWVGTYNTGLDQFWKGKFLNYTERVKDYLKMLSNLSYKLVTAICGSLVLA